MKYYVYILIITVVSIMLTCQSCAVKKTKKQENKVENEVNESTSKNELTAFESDSNLFASVSKKVTKNKADTLTGSIDLDDQETADTLESGSQKLIFQSQKVNGKHKLKFKSITKPVVNEETNSTIVFNQNNNKKLRKQDSITTTEKNYKQESNTTDKVVYPSSWWVLLLLLLLLALLIYLNYKQIKSEL